MSTNEARSTVASSARTRARKTHNPASEARWETIDAAAARLDLDPQALRARCRRAARRAPDGGVVAELGMGVIARKLGVTWRVYVPPAVT